MMTGTVGLPEGEPPAGATLMARRAPRTSRASLSAVMPISASRRPAGSVKIRLETVAYYLERHCAGILARKAAAMPAGCPLLAHR